jgi:two-component system sensor histidine kinase YesM
MLPYFQKLGLFILLSIAFVIIPVGLYVIHRVVLLPLNDLMVSMKKVKNGDFNVRLRVPPKRNEFETVHQSFNAMVSQIQSLLADVSREKINVQKEEVRCLQLQQNPHFLMNSLNIIHSLSKTHDYKLVQEMTTCLIKYFRFIFSIDQYFVYCKDEVEHCKNYLRIQEMRFSNRLNYDISMPEFLSDIPVIPLIIQTFIENSIKYAVKLDNMVYIFVEIDFFAISEKQYIKIAIKDTGPGFSKEHLDQLQSQGYVHDPEGMHTGIKNIKRRMYLLYKENAWINFSNRNGACVEIILPTETDLLMRM